MTELAIDKHKLIYHPQRVADWLAGREVFPIYVEISLVNKCNYRCSFCAFDFTHYSGEILETENLCRVIEEMANCGVKSLVFAGTGEPLVHPDIIRIIEYAAKCGLDTGLSTNGALITEEMTELLLENLSWIRFSFNAGSKESYARVHGCSGEMYKKVLNNIRQLVDRKKVMQASTTIGMQCLILESNLQEIVSLACRAKELGTDYFSLKPYSPHPDSLHDMVGILESSELETIFSDVETLATENFTVIIRRNSINSLFNNKKPYNTCYGLPFLCYLEADGLLYACNTFIGDRYCAYGNIREKSFKEIWTSNNKQEVMERLESMSQKQCRLACRLDQINNYLWRLRNLPEHVNFI